MQLVVELWKKGGANRQKFPAGSRAGVLVRGAKIPKVEAFKKEHEICNKSFQMGFTTPSHYVHTSPEGQNFQ